MRGRRPLPSYIHEVNGFPGKRKPNRREPKPKRCIPLPPARLSEQTKAAWSEYAIALDRIGVLTEVDVFVLEELAETEVEIRELREGIAKEGRLVTVTTTTGDIRQITNPLVNQLSDAAKRKKGLLVECGLTPSSRTRVNASEEADSEKDPADAYFP